MPSTEVARLEPGAYLALNHTTGEIQEIINENLAGQQLGEFDLPRVKMPSGGGKFWEIPVLGGVESSTEISGVVVAYKRTRAYWPGRETTGSPPQCRSNDTIVGIGDPGGECATCPYAQFGSAIDEKGQPGDGQACKEKEIWFLLRPDSFLPIVVALPATSLKAAKSYRVSLASGGVGLASVVTTIGLEQDTAGTGDKYSKAVVKLGALLDPADRANARAYADLLRPVFEATAAAVNAEPVIADADVVHPSAPAPAAAEPPVAPGIVPGEAEPLPVGPQQPLAPTPAAAAPPRPPAQTPPVAAAAPEA